MKNLMKNPFGYLLAVLVLLNLPLQAQERWFTVELAKNPVGYNYQQIERNQQTVKEKLEFKMVLNRLGSKTEMYFLTNTTESISGKMQKIVVTSKYSQKATVIEAIIKGQEIHLTTKVGGKSYPKKITYQGELLGAEGIRLGSMKHLKKPGDQWHFQTLNPTYQASPLKIYRKLLKKETIEVNGVKKQVWLVEEKMGKFPPSKIWLDVKDYQWIKLQNTSPFGVSDTYVSSKQKALLAASGNVLPKEMFDDTMVRSNVRLPNTKPVDKMVIKISLKNPALGWPDLTGANQKVLSQDKKHTVLEITRPAAHHTQTQVSEATRQKMAEFLQSNELINADNETIKGIAQKVVAGEKTIMSKCLALKNWVSDNMKGDMGVVLAPASEVIQNRKGTCSEFATLLSSMVRAANIPARYMMGFVYMNGIWGGHAWVEAYINNQWIPLDAAINNKGAANAARFHFLATDLNEGSGVLNGSSGVKMYGNVEVKILSYQIENQHFKIPESRKLYTITGNVYENPGVGIRLEKTSGFEFSGMTDVYPKTSILTMKSNNEKVVLHQVLLRPNQKNEDAYWKAIQNHVLEKQVSGTLTKVNYKGNIAYQLIKGQKAVWGIRRGSDLWVLDITSTQPQKLLKQILAKFEMKQSVF